MLISFSNTTTQLIKEQLPKLGVLFETNQDKNKLDLNRIKQLKGCRTELIQNCLTVIHQLDTLDKNNFFKGNERKNYLLENTQLLLKELKKYTISCEFTPRIKDFLNIIPDNISTIVGFTIIITSLLSIKFLSLTLIPLGLFSWILVDLFFNNRKAAKQLKATIVSVEDELRTLEKARDIVKNKMPIPDTRPLSVSPIPGTSRSYQAFFSAENPTSAESNQDSFSSILSKC